MPSISPQNPIPQNPILEPLQQQSGMDDANSLITLPDYTPRQGAALDIARDTFEQLITLIKSREQESQNQLGSSGLNSISVSPERHYINLSALSDSTLDEMDDLTGASSFKLVVGYNFGADDTIRVKMKYIQPK